MNEKRLEDSPIVYYTDKTAQSEWILFLHAAFVSHKMFRTQINYFHKKYNLLAVDIIGHGRSIDTKKGDTITHMSDWLFDILKAEGIERIHIVGVSLGAVLAQDFANKHSENVKSLACFGGYDINNFDVKMQKENSLSQLLMMCKALFSVKWFAKANRKISAYTAQAQNEFYQMNLLFPKKSFMYLASLNSLINKCETGQRAYPLLIGCGAFDIPAERKAVNMWKTSEPDCKTIIFENAGHCVNMDVPEEFNREMENFLESVRTSKQ